MTSLFGSFGKNGNLTILVFSLIPGLFFDLLSVFHYHLWYYNLKCPTLPVERGDVV